MMMKSSQRRQQQQHRDKTLPKGSSRSSSTSTNTRSLLFGISLLLNIIGGFIVYQLHNDYLFKHSTVVHFDTTLPSFSSSSSSERAQQTILKRHDEQRKQREERDQKALRTKATTTTKLLQPPTNISASENILGYDLKYVDGSIQENDDGSYLYSQGHCIGDNFRSSSWEYTSCKVEQLICYDLERHDYVVVTNPLEIQIQVEMQKQQQEQESNNNKNQTTANSEYASNVISYSSTTYDTFSLGVINPGWWIRHTEEEHEHTWWKLRTQWRHVQGPLSSYYMLPSNVLMVPFHSMAGFNPGHYLWDDLLPIYTLLETFDYWKNDDQPFEPLLMRMDINTSPPIWATCSDGDMMDGCREVMPRLGELFGSPKLVFDLLDKDTLLLVDNENHELHSNLLCASQGVAGIGRLSDHGEKDHGWIQETDYEWNQNVGRGVHFWNFRNFMLRKMNMNIHQQIRKDRPLIILSERSSHRSFDLIPLRDYLQEKFPQAQVIAYNLVDMELRDQLEVVSEAAIYISIAGGGTFTAMFLPKGASMILYYTINEGPARLDYDVWNNLGYLHIHWLPFEEQSKPPKPSDSIVLEAIVRHELEILKQKGEHDDE